MAKKQFTLDLPADKYDAVVSALAYSNGYQKKVTNSENQTVDNPESEEDFARKIIKRQMKQHLINWEARLASDAASTAKYAELENLEL